MTVRFLHKTIGLILLLPLVGWAVTGAIFFIKPGYAAAYEALAIKTYPLDDNQPVRIQAWREARLVKTTLGTHLLVRTDAGWRHLDPVTLRIAPMPPQDTLRRLFEDAFTANPDRYGRIVSLVDGTAVTDTGVRVTLDWNQLMLRQRGRDTDRIDGLYRVHYLQWTGYKWLDKVLGVLGLMLLVGLSYLGARLAFAREDRSDPV